MSDEKKSELSQVVEEEEEEEEEESSVEAMADVTPAVEAMAEAAAPVEAMAEAGAPVEAMAEAAAPVEAMAEAGAPVEEESDENKKLESCPMRRRLKALNLLHVELLEKNAEYYQEAFELEVKNHLIRQRILRKRSAILSGQYEPREVKSNYRLGNVNEAEEENSNAEERSFKIGKGIPNFWLKVLKNSAIRHYVLSHDEPILSHLQDIRVKLHKSPIGFTLEFHFSKNEYFNNKILTKYYEVNMSPTRYNPFCLDDLENLKTEGCEIDWKKGQNIFRKTLKKTSVTKTGWHKTVTKYVMEDSFFNFFNPPGIPVLQGEILKNLIKKDCEVGVYIKNKVIPAAIEYYTNTAPDACKDKEKDETDVDKSKNTSACIII